MDYLGGLSAEGVVVSPDGASVAYTTVPDGTLWRSRLDGSDRVQLTSMGCLLPRWSPDGSRIACSGGTSNEDARIYIVPASGGAPFRATSEKWAEFDPSWSLDGQTVLFGSNGGEAGISSGTIRTVDLKTGRVTTVPGSEGLFSPRWSPDRRFIVAMSLDSQRLALYDVSTERWTDLVSHENEIAWPNWSPDSASVLFLSNSPGGRRIRRIDLATRHLADVVDLSAINQLRGPIGRWIGVTPDGWPMITLDAGTHDIYALDWEAP